METRIKEIAERIKGLRDIMGYSVEEMAKATNLSPEEYVSLEGGEQDFTFTFLYACAKKFGVDMVELLTGENPLLSFYSIVRKNEGLDLKRREGFRYQHVGYKFKDKLAEPFVVTAPFRENEQDQPIHLSQHAGQEFDFILKGQLKVQLENHTEILREGDAIYYDSGRGHGMIATGGEACEFLAIIMKPEEEEK